VVVWTPFDLFISRLLDLTPIYPFKNPIITVYYHPIPAFVLWVAYMPILNYGLIAMVHVKVDEGNLN